MTRHQDNLRLIDAARSRAAQLRGEAELAYWHAAVRAGTRLAAALRRHTQRPDKLVEA